MYSIGDRIKIEKTTTLNSIMKDKLYAENLLSRKERKTYEDIKKFYENEYIISEISWKNGKQTMLGIFLADGNCIMFIPEPFTDITTLSNSNA